MRFWCNQIKPSSKNLDIETPGTTQNTNNDKGDFMPIKVMIRLLQIMTSKDDITYCKKIYSTFTIILKMNNELINEYI